MRATEEQIEPAIEALPGVRTGRLERFAQRLPKRQVVRYVLVGAWNTLFGYLLYAALTAAFTRITSFYPYIFGSVLSSILSITVSYLGYKWFVFKTHGNYLHEWLRAMAVYTTSATVTTVALPLLVGLLRHTTHFPRAAPYIAGAIICAASVTMSFFGHKHFSFRRSRPATAAARSGYDECQSTRAARGNASAPRHTP